MKRAKNKECIYVTIRKYVDLGPETELKSKSPYPRGDCPFCNQKEGLHINIDKQVFYCFGCHTGGDRLLFFALLKKESIKVMVDFLLRDEEV